MIRIGRVVRRLPFTWLMLAGLSMVAAFTDTGVAEISRHWLNRLGYAPRDLVYMHWDRLLASAVVTGGDGAFWEALAMIAVAVGTSEWLTGTRRAAVTFWGVHLATLLIESLVALPLHRLGFSLGTALVFARDVGPSAGYFGSLGLTLARWPKRGSRLIASGILLALIVATALPPPAGNTVVIKLTADLAHLIAFPLGWLSGRIGEDA